jgi:RHS repeat-associated protein
MTNSWDAANRLVETAVSSQPLGVSYNGVGDRVAQTVGTTTTYFALDVVGLPEVIASRSVTTTSEGNAYLHLPGVIVAESAGGEGRYLLSDGLGSVRQAVDEVGEVVASYEFDPYGNPVTDHASRITPYGYTGEWWEDEVGLLHLRARWYLPYLNQFISPDPIIPDYSDPQSLNRYSYALNNPINLTDPSGEYVGPIDGYMEGFNVSIAYPFLPGMSAPNLPGDGDYYGTASVLGSLIYNYLDKLAAISQCSLDGPPTGPRWVRKHQPLFAKELVYDFAHMQSAIFAPQSQGSGGFDIASRFLNIEIYLSVYAGPIVGLAGQDDIRGYSKNATNSVSLGGSVSKQYTMGLGGTLSTNSAKNPDTFGAFRNLLRDILDPNKSIEVTSLTGGGSIGWSPVPGMSTSGKVKSAGMIGWTTTTRMVPGTMVNYLNQPPPPGNKPTLEEVSTMARDIMSGIRYQAIWTDFWGNRGWGIFTPSFSNLNYGSPLGPTMPSSPNVSLRLSAVGNLYSYHAYSK